MISTEKFTENNFDHSQSKIKMFKKKPKRKHLETKEIQKLMNSYEDITTTSIKKFVDFPLSQKTQKGLRDAKYEIPTDIQRQSIGLALKGHDVLGAAKTGSGKTVAFLVPLLERLYLERWTSYDGLGALVITPTRELAYQIFEVLRKIGSYHDFSAGLIIGGKDLKYESKRMDKCNIIICTPGRLLQHMDENPLFDCTNLRMLVLDEADRILDLGFEKTINSIIENLPQQRQTLLFSATQTRSVKDLARLSLHHPVYISVHEYSAHRTPETLQQSYVICDVHDKLNLLWSFLRTHLKQKILVFMTSCKQVKYAYESFCRMKPGLSVLALYGSLHQLRRMAIYDEFCQKKNAVLFATDIAARGLDFPAVNWVVQLDCPEDVKTYIHRVGRTARYEGNGDALLVLLPSEQESMIRQLREDKIPIEQISINTKKFLSVQRKLEEFCSRDLDFKESAQRAFVSYLKSVFLMKDKSTFKIKTIDTDAYSRSLGLAVTPRIRFLSRRQKLEASATVNKNQSDTTNRMQDLTLSSDNDHDMEAKEALRKPVSQVPFGFEDCDYNSDEELLFSGISNNQNNHLMDDDDDDDDDEQLESFKEELKKQKTITKAALARKMLKKKVKPNVKVVFDDEGKPIEKFPTKQKSQAVQELYQGKDGFSIKLSERIMRDEDEIDKQLFRQKIKALHKEKKAKLREDRKQQDEEKSIQLANSSSDDDDEQLSHYINDLPDPDAVYNEQDSSDKETSTTVRKKRKRNGSSLDEEGDMGSLDQHRKPPKLKKKTSNFDTVLDTGLPLADDEELAMHLLSQNNT